MIKNFIKTLTGKLSWSVKFRKHSYILIYIGVIIGIVILAFLSNYSSSKNIDSQIEKCYNANDTIINLADLYPEEWDTVYFFGACSLEEIEKRIGPVINHLWCDVGNKILILNKRKEIVYYKEWDMYYGQDLEGAIFHFKNAPIIKAIPREKANFIIRKRDEDSFWVIHQE